MNKSLNNYIGFVDFLADFLGEDVEVVLHDMTNLENSVVAIRNGHISGRGIGAPATDLVLRILKNAKYDEYKYLTNYSGTSNNGKMLKSATYIIRNEKNKIVGTLCINMDVSKMQMMKNYLDKLMSFNNPTDEVISEKLSHSSQDLTLHTINNVVNDFGVPPDRLDQDEKIAIVSELNDKGVFLIKGSVIHVAEALSVSVATVYRYLGKLKREA